MRNRLLAGCSMRVGGAAVVWLSLSAAAAGGQADGRDRARPAARTFVAPRAADGHADLQGLWENNSATPLERPASLADKPRLTDDELAALKVRAGRLFSPDADAAFGDAFYLALLANASTPSVPPEPTARIGCPGGISKTGRR